MDFVNRLPPQNLEAEISVLGGMLLDNKAIPLVKETLFLERFYREAHRKIFNAILCVYEKDGIVDLVTLAEELTKREGLEEVGGVGYISSLIDSTPTAAAIKYHVKIVKEKAILRKIIQAAMQLQSAAYDAKEELKTILAMFQRFSAELIGESTDSEALGKLEAGDLSRFLSLRETPFPSLNNMLGGFFGGELIIVGGRPGMGKTSFVSDLLKYTAMSEDRPVIYFGAETSKERFYLRLLSSACDIPFKDLGKARVQEAQADRVLSAQKKIDAAPIYSLVVPKKINVVSLISEVRAKKEEIGELGFVCVENLQELTWPEVFHKRKDEADTILSALNNLAMDINTPVVLSCQISRKAEEKEDTRPTLADLKETGAIEEKAAKVLLLWRPNYYAKSEVQEKNSPEPGELIIAKGGPPMILPMEFCGYIYSWRDKTE